MKVLAVLAICLCIVVYVTSDSVDNDETSDTRSSDDDIDSDSPEGTEGRGHRHRHRGGRRHHGRHHGRHHHSRSGYGMDNWTEEEKLNHICVMLTSNVPDRFHHKFSRWSEATRTQMLECCQMSGEERLQCAQDVRNQKYDRVCNGEETMSSCMHGLSQSSAEVIRTTCCAQTGEARYKCFHEAREAAYESRHSPAAPTVPASNDAEE